MLMLWHGTGYYLANRGTDTGQYRVALMDSRDLEFPVAVRGYNTYSD